MINFLVANSKYAHDHIMDRPSGMGWCVDEFIVLRALCRQSSWLLQ